MVGTNPRFQLLFLSDERRGERIPIDRDGISIGRSADAAIHCNNPSVSRQHAVFRYMGDRLLVEDIGSSGGTLVNNTRIESNRAVQVDNGDEITFGHFHTQVLLLDDFDDAFDDGEKTMFAGDGDLPSDLAAVLACCQTSGSTSTATREVLSDHPSTSVLPASAAPRMDDAVSNIPVPTTEPDDEEAPVAASTSLVSLLILMVLILAFLLAMAVFKWPVDLMSFF
ncbi:MAG: putative component of type VI protein secretion system [Kiritimatiellia bacterium]|jgi:predicted component of type VI protein secretion system